MLEWEVTQSVWASLPGAAPLFEIYGYWPTMHDAVIRAVDFDFADRRLSVVFDYDDSVLGVAEARDARTRFVLSWVGIRESRLRSAGGSLYGMDLTREGDLIRTVFEDYTWGMDGYICSAGIEVSAVLPSPEPLSCDDPRYHEINLSMR